jgi:DNA-binding transcriptional MerR regulator
MTKDELLANLNHEAATLRVAQVSARSIADWINEGLIPAPIKKGLGRGKGLRIQYTQETLDCALLLVRLRQFGRPRNDIARIYLWVNGFEQPYEKIRSALIREFDLIARFILRNMPPRYDI